MPRIPRADVMRPVLSSRLLGWVAAPLVLGLSALALAAALGAYLAFLAVLAAAYGLTEVLERLRGRTVRGTR